MEKLMAFKGKIKINEQSQNTEAVSGVQGALS